MGQVCKTGMHSNCRIRFSDYIFSPLHIQIVCTEFKPFIPSSSDNGLLGINEVFEPCVCVCVRVRVRVRVRARACVSG